MSVWSRELETHDNISEPSGPLSGCPRWLIDTQTPRSGGTSQGAIFLSDGQFSDLVYSRWTYCARVNNRATATAAAGGHLAGVRDGVQTASQKVYSVLENSVASSPVGHGQA